MRERICVGEGAFEMLPYTSSPDAEGTLGGLIEVGRDLDRHLPRALETITRRMEELPGLRVLLFLNVPHPPGTAFDPDVVARDNFREFLKKDWPGPRQPELYYDRRSLANRAEDRGAIHAKAIAVDGQTALVTSANFTEAAHARNVEAGALVRVHP